MPNPGTVSVERTQGCWNCVHFSRERGHELWKVKRQNDLALAAKIAIDESDGEASERVMQIKKMVNTIDHGVALGIIGRCTVPSGSTADLVVHSYLCDRWTAAQGASVARAGQAADKLPDELMEDMQNGILPKKRIT